MNAQVQSSLDTMESSLQTLLDSISSYNPSPAAAQEVVAADIALVETLTQRSCTSAPQNPPSNTPQWRNTSRTTIAFRHCARQQCP
jgi:hypothetical protein